MEFKDRLNKLLYRHKISAKNLALHLNISENTIRKWLKGTSKPRISSLLKLCSLFNVRCNYLLGIDNKIR